MEYNEVEQELLKLRLSREGGKMEYNETERRYIDVCEMLAQLEPARTQARAGLEAEREILKLRLKRGKAQSYWQPAIDLEERYPNFSFG